MSGDLPPGVSESMIPGNRPQDAEHEALCEQVSERVHEVAGSDWTMMHTDTQEEVIDALASMIQDKQAEATREALSEDRAMRKRHFPGTSFWKVQIGGNLTNAGHVLEESNGCRPMVCIPDDDDAPKGEEAAALLARVARLPELERAVHSVLDHCGNWEGPVSLPVEMISKLKDAYAWD